jgi:hypothetical protein
VAKAPPPPPPPTDDFMFDNQMTQVLGSLDSLSSAPGGSGDPFDVFAGDDDQAEDEQRVEQLTDKLRANPSDIDVALELADVLARLKRHLDLLALLSARLEEGAGDHEDELQERRRAVLLELAAEARSEGRDGEATLYEDMAKRDDD